jgi:hypothetical protein
LPNKDRDKRARRREVRKEKLKKKTLEQKLPWEERKKRLQQRRKKERMQKNIKNSLGAIAIVTFIIFIILLIQNIDIEERGLKGGGTGWDYDPEDWESTGDVSMPEDDPDIKGMVNEKLGDYSFILITRGGEENYLIIFDENSNIWIWRQVMSQKHLRRISRRVQG